MPFDLEVRFAIAGAVTEGGRPLPHASLRISDGAGGELRRVETNQFGLYRVDGLPPGQYHVAVVRDDTIVANLPVTVTDDFLFGQDIAIGTDQP